MPPYYSPVLCRWISEDPIRESGGLNLYQFCGNNPVNGIDLYGEFTWSEWGEINGAFVERWSRGAQGVVNAFTGGLFNPEDGVFYDTFNDQWENLSYDSNKCNSNFDTGMLGGRVAVGSFTAAGGAWAAERLGWKVAFNYYPNAKGVGVNVLKNGTRKFGLDYHRFKSVRSGEIVTKLHKHTGKTKTQMKKHLDVFTGKPL